MNLPSTLPQFYPSSYDDRKLYNDGSFDHDVSSKYMQTRGMLNAVYTAIPASERTKLFKPFVELRLLQERINVADQMAKLIYYLSTGELQSRNSELRSKMAIEKFINEGKNPDEELRKLHPALDTRILSQHIVDFLGQLNIKILET